MEKVFVLSRMWDKIERGHETVEIIATEIEPILDYITKYSYVGDVTAIEMDESIDMDGFCKKDGFQDIKDYFNWSEKHVCQHFIRMSGFRSGYSENIQTVLYRLQVRNVH